MFNQNKSIKKATHLIHIRYVAFYILLFNSLIFEFKELILILKFSNFPSILTNKYIVTIAGNPKFATNCIKSTSTYKYPQKTFKIAYNALLIIQKGIAFLYKISSIHLKNSFMYYATKKSNSVVSV